MLGREFFLKLAIRTMAVLDSSQNSALVIALATDYPEIFVKLGRTVLGFNPDFPVWYQAAQDAANDGSLIKAVIAVRNGNPDCLLLDAKRFVESEFGKELAAGRARNAARFEDRNARRETLCGASDCGCSD